MRHEYVYNVGVWMHMQKMIEIDVCTTFPKGDQLDADVTTGYSLKILSNNWSSANRETRLKRFSGQFCFEIN